MPKKLGYLLTTIFALYTQASFAASTYYVTTNADSGAGSLRTAITSANGNAGSTIIICSATIASTGCTGAVGSGLANAITLGSNLQAVTASTTICYSNSATSCSSPGTQVTISGASAYSLFATAKAGLTLENVVLTNGLAIGANGAIGSGGGGLGAGGGVYVDANQALTLTNITISNCVAAGGTGAVGAVPLGGGTGGAGGNASFGTSAGNSTLTGYTVSGTGAGGSGGKGDQDFGTAGSGGGGGTTTATTGNGTNGATGGNGSGSTAGNGGAGGNAGYFSGSGGGGGGGGVVTNPSSPDGGGGGGGGGGVSSTSTGGSGGTGLNQSGLNDGTAGGIGGLYGQGGGGGVGGGGVIGGLGGGIGGGGGGGFGGGGGGTVGTNAAAGAGGGGGGGGGGWGGGGGGGGGSAYGGGVSQGTGGEGGVYAGSGGNGNPGTTVGGGGGGGAGVGGAIFAAQNATITLSQGTIGPGAAGTNVKGGGSNGTGGGGQGVGPDIFLFKAATLNLTGSSNQAIGAIDSDTNAPSGSYDGGVSVSLGSSSSIATFNGASYTYHGGTTIASGYVYLSTNPLANIGNVFITTANGGLLQAVNTVSTTGTFSNSGGTLIVAAILNRGNYTSFTSTGAVYLAGANGAITGSGTLSGTTLSVGKDPTGNITPVANTYAPTYALNFANTNIYTGSAVNSNAAFSGNMYVLGNGSFDLTGTVSGTSLTIGQDLGAVIIDNTTNFVAASPITGWGTINVNHGAFSASGANTVAAATAFSVLSTGTANLGSALSGAGTFTNAGAVNVSANGSIGTTGTFSNSGTIISNAALNTTIFTNATNTSPLNSNIIKINGAVLTTNSNFINNGSLYVYNSNAGIAGALTAGTGTLYIGYDGATTYNATNFSTNAAITQPTIDIEAGTLTFNDAVTAVTAFAVAANSTVNIASTLSGNGTGTFYNAGAMLFSSAFATTNFSGTPTNASTGSMKINNVTLTTNSNFTNDGNLYIYNTSGGLSGALTSGSGTLYIGYDGATTYNTTDIATNAAITQPSINIAAGTFTSSANNAVTVSTALTIASGTTATFNSSLSGAGTLNNNSTGTSIGSSGSFGMSGNITNAGTITNNGSMAIVQSVTGAGSLVNGAGGIMQLKTNAAVAQAITNQANGQLIVVNNAQTESISNAGSFSVDSGVTLTANGSITGNGTVTMAGDSAITATSYTNTGTHTTNISGSGASNVGKVTTTGAIDVAAIVVTSSVTTGGPWTILTAGAGELTYGSYTPPSSSGGTFVQWSFDTSDNTNFIIELTSKSFSSVAIGPINQAIAAVLDAMNNYSNKNAGQQALLNALSAAANAEEFNDWLQELMPNNNATTPSIFLQDKVFRRVETRIASLQQDFPAMDYGIAAGDINHHTAMWMGGFASYARLAPNFWGENLGYRSKAYGAILGFDFKCDNGEVYGLGIGLSKSIVFEYSNNDNTTDIIGYHGVAYGTNFMLGDQFIEWLLTGATTLNTLSRQINIDDVIMSTTGKYHGGQGAVRLNYGVDFMQNDFSFAPLAMLQYVASYQPNYTEQYSPAALTVQPTHFQNVLTVGAGVRIDMPSYNWLYVGVSELRLMGTWDAVSSDNNVASAFVVGSPDFVLLNSPPERLALRAGIDMTFVMSECVHVQLSYDYELRHQYYDHSGTAKIKFLF